MSLTNQCSLQSTNCKITCDMPICYAGDNTLTMQNYDCIVLHGFLKQISFLFGCITLWYIVPHRRLLDFYFFVFEALPYTVFVFPFTFVL